jgi:hypothetical protein
MGARFGDRERGEPVVDAEDLKADCCLVCGVVFDAVHLVFVQGLEVVVLQQRGVRVPPRRFEANFLAQRDGILGDASSEDLFGCACRLFCCWVDEVIGDLGRAHQHFAEEQSCVGPAVASGKAFEDECVLGSRRVGHTAVGEAE